jgi:hypothetical protein
MKSNHIKMNFELLYILMGVVLSYFHLFNLVNLNKQIYINRSFRYFHKPIRFSSDNFIC